MTSPTAERRQLAERLLLNPDYAAASNTHLAAVSGLSESLIRRVRKRLEDENVIAPVPCRFHYRRNKRILRQGAGRLRKPRRRDDTK